MIALGMCQITRVSVGVPEMSKISGEYRAQAAELHARARMEPDPKMKAGFEKLAQGYIHLAEIAERGRRNNIVVAASKLQSDNELSQ